MFSILIIKIESDPKINKPAPLMAMFSLVICLIVSLQSSCANIEKTASKAQAGETIAIAFKSNAETITKDNTLVAIEDAVNNRFVYYSGDSRIRAIINTQSHATNKMSSVITDVKLYNAEIVSKNDVASVTNSGKMLFQKIAYIDLPASIGAGMARVGIDVSGLFVSANVEIIDGVEEGDISLF